MNHLNATKESTPDRSAASAISRFERLESRDRFAVLRPAKQSRERPAARRVVDEPAHTLRLSKSGSTDKRAARLARFARCCANDPKVGLGHRYDNLAHDGSVS